MFTQHKVKTEYLFLLSADELFCDLTPESLVLLDKIKRTKRIGKGRRFFAKGDMPHSIYLLREGQAQLLVKDESEDKYRARLIKPNEIFGLTEVFANLPYEMNAETITSCLYEFIEREDFIDFLKDEPGVCFRLAQFLALHFQINYRIFSAIN